MPWQIATRPGYYCSRVHLRDAEHVVRGGRRARGGVPGQAPGQPQPVLHAPPHEEAVLFSSASNIRYVYKDGAHWGKPATDGGNNHRSATQSFKQNFVCAASCRDAAHAACRRPPSQHRGQARARVSTHAPAPGAVRLPLAGNHAPAGPALLALGRNLLLRLGPRASRLDKLLRAWGTCGSTAAGRVGAQGRGCA